MSVNALELKSEYTQTFDDNYKEKLNKYLNSNPASCFYEVINYMINHSVRLEQEAFYI